MATTITTPSGVITPALVLGYTADVENTGVTHSVIGTGVPSYTVGVDSRRTGTLNLLFATSAAAWTARTRLLVASTFTLASTDEPNMAMTFVRAGSMTISNDAELTVWTLDVGYAEVTP